MVNEDFVLLRDCPATLIPAGDAVVLRQGATVTVTQALGGSLTVRDAMGLYRISPRELDALGPRARDWATSQAQTAATNPVGDFSEEQVWEALRQCFDPEIPVNIVDLGLIYDLRIETTESGTRQIFAKMTLTAAGCGMGPIIAEDARGRLLGLPGVSGAQVDIVWDPPWTPHMISPAGRQKLGLE
ncbi:MAG TPA: iron-sulfur cluster assembly protein [Opitutales bacterium]|jgi:probable FeS assembly SUF system protein SufT|nr:iron-sulfur cluster assembly protein [Opitutales bacterium]